MSDRALRVLLVEDLDADAELIRLELEGFGYSLRWRRVQSEAQLVEALEEPWDVIVSDYRMPGFDGMRAFEIFKRSGVDTPFIFVSGVLGEERAVTAMQAGARDYVLKGNLARLGPAVQRELAEASNRATLRAAQTLAERERRRLEQAVETSGVGLFELADEPMPLVHYSERFQEILGYERDRLPSSRDFAAWLLEHVHPEDQSVTRAGYRRFAEGHERRYATECRLRHAQGAWITVAIFMTALERDASGHLTHSVGVVLDQTERKLLEQQLLQAQKMDVVGRLAGGVAHDFNNLLTVIFGFGAFVLERLPEDEALREDMREVLSAAERAEALTTQLLTFSRPKAIDPKVLRLNSIVDTMQRMLLRLVGEHIDLRTKLADDLWNVRMDPGMLEQVIVNLVVNARDAMPRGGKLSIETYNRTLEERGATAGSDEATGEYVAMVVSDTGVGMDAETQRQIFEPFFTTKGTEGTGLGLSTCHGIIKQAGGFMRVESSPGRGTSVEVWLPRVAHDLNAELQAPGHRELRGFETLLVVEDDVAVRRATARALSSLGYDVLQAGSAAEALSLYPQIAGKLGLLLTDVVLPGQSGKELAEQLVSKQPGLKVLYMSGHVTGVPGGEAMAAAMRPLRKPFTPEELALRVRSTLER